MWARIQDGQVAELTHEDPEGRFHPDLIWRPVPADLHGVVAERWRHVDDVFIPPEPPPPPLPDAPSVWDLCAAIDVMKARIAALEARAGG